MFLLLIPFGMLVVGMGILLARYLVSPIIRCRDAFRCIENNEIGVQLDNHYLDEIGDLLGGFNEMSAALSHLIEQNKVMDTMRKDMELKMLEQQINPHFLYNTLDLINGLILAKQEEEAVTVCEMLGQMFRYNLRNIRIVSLREEWQYVEAYLHIAKLKQPKLHLYQDIDENVLDYLVPKMILQPLIENAMKHGFVAESSEYCITIEIKEKEGKIHINIMDNGVGIPTAVLSTIEHQFSAIRGDRNIAVDSHIGLVNIYHRLLLEYHSDFQMQLISREGYGTKVELFLPKV